MFLQKIIKKIGTALLLFILLAGQTNAATFGKSDSYEVGSEETIKDNLYAIGTNVLLQGTILGDLFTGGSNVLISNNIQDDLFALGSTITIDAYVGDDVRAAGSTIFMNGTVSGETMLAGSLVTINPDAVFERDVLIAGESVSLFGTYKNSVKVLGKKISLNGIFDGDVTIKKAENLTIGKNAVIKGKFSYESQNKATIEEGAKITNEAEYIPYVISTDKENAFKKAFASLFETFLILKIVGWFLFILVMLHFFPRIINKMVTTGHKQFWFEILLGFIIFTVMPIACVLAAITGIGLPFAFIGFMSYIMFIIFGGIAGTVMIGTIITKSITKKDGVTWYGIIIGLIVLTVIKFIPVIGWLIYAIFLMAGIGRIGKLWYEEKYLPEQKYRV